MKMIQRYANVHEFQCVHLEAAALIKYWNSLLMVQQHENILQGWGILKDEVYARTATIW